MADPRNDTIPRPPDTPGLAEILRDALRGTVLQGIIMGARHYSAVHVPEEAPVVLRNDFEEGAHA